MALITAPAFRFRSIEWTLDRPAQVNASGFSGVREFPANPWFGKWFAKVTLATITGEDSFAPIRSFLVRCLGPTNSFQLPATVEAQNSNSGVTVTTTTAAGSNTLPLSGASTPLLAGQYATVNGQLLQLTADQAAGSITFEPALRAQATAGTAVETANPTATMFLTDPEPSWTIAPYARFDASFTVEEAF